MGGVSEECVGAAMRMRRELELRLAATDNCIHSTFITNHYALGKGIPLSHQTQWCVWNLRSQICSHTNCWFHASRLTTITHLFHPGVNTHCDKTPLNRSLSFTRTAHSISCVLRVLTLPSHSIPFLVALSSHHDKCCRRCLQRQSSLRADYALCAPFEQRQQRPSLCYCLLRRRPPMSPSTTSRQTHTSSSHCTRTFALLVQIQYTN